MKAPLRSDLASTLLRYKAWADERTYEAVAALPRREIEKERQTTFGTIGHTLQHSLIVEEIFKAHLEARPHGHTARTAKMLPPTGVLHQRVKVMNEWWVALADRLTTTELGEPIDFAFLSGEPGRMTRMEIVFHIVQHATYHRGYVDDMLYQVPVTPPATDLTVYLNGDDRKG